MTADSPISLNTYDGPAPAGVPNPFGIRVHAYPTRYHGPVYTRPMFAYPWMDRPNDFGVLYGMSGLGQEPAAAAPEPRTEAECTTLFPVPEELNAPGDFAAYMQHQACVERVRQGRDSRRWLIGLAVAFVGGYVLGRKP